MDRFRGRGLHACWQQRDIYVKKKRYMGSVIEVTEKVVCVRVGQGDL